MPGVVPLARELGVNHKTVRAASRHLEDEGLLVSEGKDRHRRIVLPDKVVPSALRIAFLGYDPPSKNQHAPFILEALHSLSYKGHRAFFRRKDADGAGHESSARRPRGEKDGGRCLNYGQVLRRIVHWADNLARGKTDRQLSVIGSLFVEGGTMGPTAARLA